MGYFNSFYKFGLERAINLSKKATIDAWIIPDWPLEESRNYIQPLTEANIDLIHLIAPNTPWDRIHIIDAISTAFIYCVAYTGVTGKDNKPTSETLSFLSKLKTNIRTPTMIGFGIKNHKDYVNYNKYSQGVIIGSSFIKMLDATYNEKISYAVEDFIRKIRGIKSKEKT
jgi:tryptophan synthase alpha chain